MSVPSTNLRMSRYKQYSTLKTDVPIIAEITVVNCSEFKQYMYPSEITDLYIELSKKMMAQFDAHSAYLQGDKFLLFFYPDRDNTICSRLTTIVSDITSYVTRKFYAIVDSDLNVSFRTHVFNVDPSMFGITEAVSPTEECAIYMLNLNSNLSHNAVAGYIVKRYFRDEKFYDRVTKNVIHHFKGNSYKSRKIDVNYDRKNCVDYVKLYSDLLKMYTISPLSDNYGRSIDIETFSNSIRNSYAFNETELTFAEKKFAQSNRSNDLIKSVVDEENYYKTYVEAASTEVATEEASVEVATEEATEAEVTASEWDIVHEV